MLRHAALRQASASVAALIVVTPALGFGYPLVVTGISQLFFRHQANGSLVYHGGKLVGSALLGQSFTDSKGNPLPQYFQPRPSAVDDNGAGSGASNLGPSSQELIKEASERERAYRVFNHLPANAAVPVDAVTASGSGLDPDISVQNALDQASRVAAARHLPAARVVALVHTYTTGPQLGFMSESVVNVLQINMALDGLR
jgi:potassium-transporting ATPase KdpC subunit